MKLFAKLKKKQPQKQSFDEKKLAQVAEYQSSGRQTIKDLQVKLLWKNYFYITGKVWCKPLDKEIGIDLYDDDVTLEYAEKCVEAMNSMPEELIDAICRAAKQYCLEYLDAIGAKPEDIDMPIPVDNNTPLREILKCFEIGCMTVEAPRDPTRIGYQLSGNCDWEIEHGIEIDILDDKLVYMSGFSDESPWDDHSSESWNCAAHIYDEDQGGYIK